MQQLVSGVPRPSVLIPILKSFCSILTCLFLFVASVPPVPVRCEEPRPKTQDIVVRLEPDYTMTFTELQKFVYDFQYNYRNRKNPARAYYQAMDDMIANQLKLYDFFDLGLHKRSELLQGIKRRINEELVIHYYNTQYYQKYINEDSMRHAYQEMHKQVVWQQIVLSKPVNAAQTTVDSLQALALNIETTARSGVSFTDLAQRYSQDAASARQGGSMAPLDWSATLTSRFNDIVFHLAVGEERVVESKDAFHIVHVVNYNTLQIPPYDSVKENIRKILHERFADFCLQEFEQAKKQSVDEKTLRWNSRALRQLLQWSNIPKFYESTYADTLRQAISHGRNFLILQYAAGKVYLKDYLRLLDEVLTWGRNITITEEDIKKFILEAVRTERITQKARALNLEKDILNSTTTNPVLRSEILRIYNSQVVEGKIPNATDDALKEFYQETKDSLFYQLAKVNIFAVIDSDRNRIVELKHKLDQNTPFEKLAPEILVKTYIRQRDGTMDTFLEDEPPFLADTAFHLKLYEVTGPVEYINPAKGKQYAVIKCMGIQEEKQLSFEDARKKLVPEFRNYYWNKINRTTIETLKKKHPVTIYMETLREHLLSAGINP